MEGKLCSNLWSRSPAGDPLPPLTLAQELCGVMEARCRTEELFSGTCPGSVRMVCLHPSTPRLQSLSPLFDSLERKGQVFMEQLQVLIFPGSIFAKHCAGPRCSTIPWAFLQPVVTLDWNILFVCVSQALRRPCLVHLLSVEQSSAYSTLSK